MKNDNSIAIWENWQDYTTKPAMYEALAEECFELAKAALKTVRILRGENPTPVRFCEASEQVEEEFTDVISCAVALELDVNSEQSVNKFDRMKQRYKKFYDV